MRKKLSLFISIVAIALALNQMHQAIFGLWESYLGRSLHLVVAFVLIFLIYPLSKKELEGKLKGKLSFGIDMLLVIVTIGIGTYMAVNRYELLVRVGVATTLDLVLGGIFLLIILEATRRTVGIALPILIFILLAFTVFGRSMPGPFLHSGSTIPEIIDMNFLSFEGVLGIAAAVLVTYIFVYIIFASFLIETKIPDFFKDVSYLLMGRQTGGIGKVAVVSSAFMGSISGSAVANVMTTGSYTIPAMKKSGYPPTFAGAIEAAASTGGQFMPPIMAAAGFLLAAFIGVPYVQVIIAAFIPALLYFTSVGVSVHASCLRYGLKGISKEELPKKRDVLKKSFLMIPIVVLIAVLLQGYTAHRAGVWAIITTIAVSFILKETRLTLKKFLRALENATRSVLQITAACATAGLLIVLVLLSGLGFKMPAIVTFFAGDNLFIAAIVAAIGTLIVTCGMTTTAGYVIGATLLAPVLIHQYGTPELATHLFILYFVVITNITPPVAFAGFAAATLAGTNMWRTSIEGFTFAISGFVIPFLFLMEPALLLQGSFYQIIIAIIIALVAVTSLSFSLRGFGREKTNILVRILLFTIPIMLVIPYYFPGYQWLTYLALFLFAFALVIFVSRWRAKQ